MSCIRLVDVMISALGKWSCKSNFPPIFPPFRQKLFGAFSCGLYNVNLREENEPLSAKKRYFLLTLVKNMRDLRRVIGDKKLESEFISKLNEFSSQ